MNLEEALRVAKAGSPALQRRVLDRILRCDLTSFVRRSFDTVSPGDEYKHNWHIDVIAEKLEAVRRGEVKRLIINVPPRNLKSVCASVAFPAWLLGQDPTKKVICVSYAQDLSEKLARDCRSVVESDWYRRVFPGTVLSAKRKSVQEFATTRQGFRLATSIGGVLTGRGADIIIIDDPLKPDDAVSDAQRRTANDWFDSTLYSRLNDKKEGAIVLIMQRLHEDDLVGHVLGKETWEVVRFPALAEEDEVHEVRTLLGPRCFTRQAGEALHPEREPVDVLERMRRTIGDYNFAGQYQQAPAPKGGGVLKRAWWRTWDDALARRNGVQPGKFQLLEYVVASLDTAYTTSEENDYSALTVWGVWNDSEGQPRLMLMRAWRARLQLHDLVQKVAATAAKRRIDRLLIEAKAAGHSVAQEIGRLCSGADFGIELIDPKGADKVARAYRVQHLFSNGLVFAPDRPWAAMVIDECARFPRGRYDDLVDSTTQALHHLRQIGLLKLPDEHRAEVEAELNWRPGEPLTTPYDT
jgi:predicted phage terminase large subunit-like protein